MNQKTSDRLILSALILAVVSLLIAVANSPGAEPVTVAPGTTDYHDKPDVLLKSAMVPRQDERPTPITGTLPAKDWSSLYVGSDIGSITAKFVAGPTYLTVYMQCCGGKLTVNMSNGEVVIPPGHSLTEASLEFWRAVAVAFPQARQSIIEGEGKK